MRDRTKPRAIVTHSQEKGKYNLRIHFEYETVFYENLRPDTLGDILIDENIEIDQLKGVLTWAELAELY